MIAPFVGSMGRMPAMVLQSLSGPWRGKIIIWNQSDGNVVSRMEVKGKSRSCRCAGRCVSNRSYNNYGSISKIPRHSLHRRAGFHSLGVRVVSGSAGWIAHGLRGWRHFFGVLRSSSHRDRSSSPARMELRNADQFHVKLRSARNWFPGWDLLLVCWVPKSRFG
jgi:hypothetical protein